MDVGVDTHDFRLWHFDEINLVMTEKAKGLSELRRTDPLQSVIGLECSQSVQRIDAHERHQN